MNNKKQLLLSIGLVLILVLMIAGISYAAFKFTGLGTKPNTITTGAITMEYTESTNTISMTGALPTTDATGKVRLIAGEYFDFTIKSSIKGNANINWEIAAEDITPSSAKKMAGKNIKLYLTKLNGDKEEEVMAPKVYNATTSANTKTGRPSGVMSLATGTMSASETTNYRLRMYVDEDYNPQGDGGGLSFSVKINAYGKVKEASTGSKIKAYVTQADLNKEDFTPPQTDFHTDAYMSKITSIITKNDNIVPETAVESWDISEAGDGSVMAYVEDDGTSNSTYKLTIGGKGGIIANESMIGYFSGFSKMTSIDLSALDTSEVTNMMGMFGGCSDLTNLDVSKFDTSNVTDMSWMFSSCTGLTSLDVSNFNAPQLTDITDMFAGLTNLETLNLSNFNAPQLTDITDMFAKLTNLVTLNLSNFNAPKITNMDAMFKDLSKLSKLDLTNFNTANVTSMREMFRNCSSLTSLDLSSFDTTNVTSMREMFRNCSSLTNLDVSNFYTSNVTEMHSIFFGCGSLTSLDVSNFDTSNVTNMDAMFNGCSKLTSLDVSNFDTSQVTNMGSMFSYCSSLTSLDLRSFDTSNVTNMDSMFYECSSLTSLDVSNFNTSEVTDMGYMFEECSSLTSLDVSNFDTSKVTKMYHMFSRCSKLTQITVSNKWVIGSSTYVADMFYNCGTDHVTVV